MEPRVDPTVRRAAERLLRQRLDGMSTGEKISLGRRSPRTVFAALLEDPDPRILRALLGNPRLLEHDAVKVASDGRSRPEVLSFLASHPVWGRRRSVREALVRHPRTPVPVALGLVSRFPRRELTRLIRDAAVPKIVRVGAERRLQGRMTRE